MDASKLREHSYLVEHGVKLTSTFRVPPLRTCMYGRAASRLEDKTRSDGHSLLVF